MRLLIEENEYYIVYYHEGITTFKGCSCYKNCDCHDNFKPESYTYYTVKKKIGRRKNTTKHNTIEEVRDRVNNIIHQTIKS